MRLRPFASSWKVWTALAVVAGMMMLRARASRVRRQDERPAATKAAPTIVPMPPPPPVRRQPEIDPRNAIVHDRAQRRRHARSGPLSVSARRLPRSAFAAALALVAIAPGIVLARPAARHAFPTLTAQAADTPDGMVFVVTGSGFAPNADVSFSWHHPGPDAVSGRATASGDVQVDVPMPSPSVTEMASVDGTVNLVATDGANTATQPVPVTTSVAAAMTGGARVKVNGDPYFLLGTNYPWVNYGNDFGSNAWGSYGVHSGGSYAADFADMAAKGVHVVRWWVFADGRAGIDYAPDGTPIRVQQTVLNDLDRAISIARQNNIYLDLVLFDFSLLNNPSHNGGVEMGGHSDLISDPRKRSALINNVIRPLALTYDDQPTIAAWELMNEPEFGISDLPQAAVNSALDPVTTEQFWSFASAASQMFHVYSQSPVTVGSASLKWNAVWTDAFAEERGLPPLHLDFYETHYYPWMDGWVINDPVLGKTTMSPLTQPVAALNLDKPIVVGEAYMPPGSGKKTLDTILNNGYAGVLGWSYGPNHTGDGMTVDWSAFDAWESSHSAITRIATADDAPDTPASGTPTSTPRPGTATPTPPPATATATKRPATNTPMPTATGGTDIGAGPTSTVAVPVGEVWTPVATNTATRTPTPVPTQAPTATSTPSGGGSGFDAQYCATVMDPNGHSQCGNPANFCDTWVGGFCNDYRYTQLPPGSERAFGSDPRDDVSVDCFSITNTQQLPGYPYYLPTDMSEWAGDSFAEQIPFPCAFASMEHFMTRIEDGQFGQLIIREKQPFDFAGRTGHIHLDAALNTGARRYFRLVLSPQLTKVTTDDRHQDRPFPQDALELWFSNGQLVGHLIKDGVTQDALPFCNGCGPHYPGTLNARDPIDIFLSRTHIKIVVAGKTMYDVDMPDLGFDRSYVYLDHVNYNGCKGFAIEHHTGPEDCTVAGNTFHWDNFAFDGPVLPKNGLTPAGSEDVVFNAYGQTSCTVNGVAAASVAMDPGSEGWTSWVARLPAHTAVSPTDVQCQGSSLYRGSPMGFEVVQQ